MRQPPDQTSLHHGYRIEIHQDLDFQDCDEFDDDVVKIASFHRCYDFSTKGAVRTVEEAKAIEASDKHFCLPVYMFDHSGLRFATESEMFRAADNQQWDWGKLGIVYVSKKDAKASLAPKKAKAAEIEEKAMAALRQRIEYLNDVHTGNVWGYQIFKVDDDEHEDSCWGFVGDKDYCIKEARSHLAHILRRDRKLKILPLFSDSERR